MNELHPCPACQRHVRKNESSCPFCGESVSLAALPAHALPKRRLGRAATFAFGATVVGATSLIGCEDDNGGAVAVYGGPPAAGAGGTSDGGTSLGGSPVYGAPPGGTTSVGGIGGESSGGAPVGGEAGAESGGSTSFPVYGGPPAGAGQE